MVVFTRLDCHIVGSGFSAYQAPNCRTITSGLIYRFQVGFFPYHAVFSGHCHSLSGMTIALRHHPGATRPLVGADTLNARSDAHL
jgi:hypothetical protein